MRAGLVPSATIVVLLVGAGSALAQEADCGGFKWSVERERTAFTTGTLPTVVSGGALPGVGEAVVAHLARQDATTFTVQPSRRPRNAPAYAGSYALGPITTPGAYDITISQDAWIDVVQGGTVLHQTGFTGSKTCTEVHKSVRFELAKGTADILISDSAEDNLKIEVLTPP